MRRRSSNACRSFPSAGGEAIPQFLETVIVRKDGVHVPIEVAYSVVELGGAPATVAFLRDISERKRTEEALRHSEELFRKLVEAAPEAVLVARDKLIAYVNPRFLRLLGYQHVDELLGRSSLELIHADDRVMLDERLRVIQQSIDGVPMREYRRQRRDGRSLA